ncbi:MAG: hypothetical protein GY757_21480 [bacterium]|nr:hypothetical protein [bacterium]
MDRKEFFKTTMKSGACACAMMFMGNGTALAEEKKNGDNKKENKEAEKKKKQDEATKKFIGNWTESLMLIMDENLDEKTKRKIMKASGRKCAQRTFNPTAVKFKNNVKGLLAKMESEWAENTSYDEKKGVITIHTKKYNKCFCPLAGGKQTFKTATFCLCTRGYMTETFEIVTGKKVDVKTLNTVLTGSDHCSYQITIL